MKRFFKTRIFFIFIFSMILSSCSLPVSREPYAQGYIERGIASWYGEEFHGRPTSSGEIYDMHALTAAHKLMPLGTVAKVTNLENGRSVTVKINDRGPFIDDRIIDLSYGSAGAIDMVETGLAPVEIEVLKWGERISDFTIQVGSFAIQENAIRLKNRLEQKYADVYIIPYDKDDMKFYRVRVGIMKDIKEAEQLAGELSATGLVTFITRKD
ncbi:MAG: septal ring lytic transglycosylase RlpA family protein [Nitrospirae bacterium]|nr:septal ring lytic transglycosylase RlpA family protein [Nitrospirota bacterium]MBI5096203.1 septal ring lytic transglycosylase RlpA family protein [Nitrospirota bacterium]